MNYNKKGITEIKKSVTSLTITPINSSRRGPVDQVVVSSSIVFC